MTQGVFLMSVRASPLHGTPSRVPFFKPLAKPANIEYIDMPADLAGKYQNYTCADRAKVQRILEDKAECAPLENHVHDYVNNYLLPGKLW